MEAKAISERIHARRKVIAEKAVDRQFREHTDLARRYGPERRAKTVSDGILTLENLADAIALNSPGLFLDYTGWLKVLLLRRQVRVDDLIGHYGYLQDVIHEELEPPVAAAACRHLRDAMRMLPAMPESGAPIDDGADPVSLLASQYLRALLKGDRHHASQLVLDAAAAGMPLRDIYLGVFQVTQHEIGRMWQGDEITVAQEHFCTAATQLVMSQLYPKVFATPKHDGVMVATCVAGNLHELGVRMVADFFEMAGWHTYYLGANTPHAGVLATIVERKADVLAISATLPYHLAEVKELTAMVRRHPACGNVKVLVGGLPFNRDSSLWQQCGADGTALDADRAIELANRLTGRLSA